MLLFEKLRKIRLNNFHIAHLQKLLAAVQVHFLLFPFMFIAFRV